MSRIMEILEVIKEQVESNPILLYMKGSPDQPQCGLLGTGITVTDGVWRAVCLYRHSCQ